MTVKRYDMSGFGDGMVEREDGAFYHMDDYDALLSLNAELLEALEEVAGDLFLQIEPKHGAKAASQYPSFVKARAAIAKARSAS